MRIGERENNRPSVIARDTLDGSRTSGLSFRSDSADVTRSLPPYVPERVSPLPPSLFFLLLSFLYFSIPYVGGAGTDHRLQEYYFGRNSDKILKSRRSILFCFYRE